MKDEEKNIRNFCNGNECSRCGHCCPLCLPITRKEEKTIRKYIQDYNIEPENLFINKNFYCRCCFYDAKNKCCKIYKVRPAICKSFKCNRNENILEKEKCDNHERAYWNHIGKDGKIKHITSFDLLFYNDPRPLLAMLIDRFIGSSEELTEEGLKKLKFALKKLELEDLIDALPEEV